MFQPECYALVDLDDSATVSRFNQGPNKVLENPRASHVPLLQHPLHIQALTYHFNSKMKASQANALLVKLSISWGNNVVYHTIKSNNSSLDALSSFSDKTHVLRNIVCLLSNLIGKFYLRVLLHFTWYLPNFAPILIFPKLFLVET